MTRSKRLLLCCVAVFCGGLATAGLALGEDIYKGGDWANLASDRTARHVGDSLTVTIAQVSTASNSSHTASQRRVQLVGDLSTGSHSSSGRVSFDGGNDGGGSTQRSDRLIAQLSVIVTEVLPNSDLRVEGQQAVRIDGRQTVIRVQGRVRQADIAPDNSIPSTRLAEAKIDYGGSGFSGRKGAGRLLGALFSALGLQ